MWDRETGSFGELFLSEEDLKKGTEGDGGGDGGRDGGRERRREGEKEGRREGGR